MFTQYPPGHWRGHHSRWFDACRRGRPGRGAQGQDQRSEHHLRVDHPHAGGLEFAAGNYADKVFKTGAITYSLKLLPNTNGTITVKVPSVVLYTSTGSLSGTATATVTIANSKETITNGKLNLTKGTGALKGDSFKGTFTGTGDLTKNVLVFHTKGILTH